MSSSSRSRCGKQWESSCEAPASRYAAFRRRQQHQRTMAGQFEKTLPFSLDDFQRCANEALEKNCNVLVAAPTGAGKTVVADFAVYLAHARGVKAFYTTPIKALSNQKYHDLSNIYGADNVGLLTGDTSVNPEADIVVMTTEVLRNMLYEHSITLASLGYVILDEVHYLADKFRGPVWEEVIIHLPKEVKIIGLSATVSNVEDFSAWIASVRGSSKLIVDEHRPVPLERHVMLQRDEQTEPILFDLYDRNNTSRQHELRINPALTRTIEDFEHRASRRANTRRQRNNRHGRIRKDRSFNASNAQRYFPKRWAVVDELNYLDMLPGIYFIFSRSGCDQAVQQCLRAGLSLTSDEEMYEIRRIVDTMVADQLSRDDLHALHFATFRYALEQGFAAHHAGMIALFRHIVETLFERGLIKTVFATETLALGLNMPARSVIVERLTKFDGSGHVPLTPGEFTQLTGRAGRRGIDDIGHAVLIDHADFQPQVAAALSSKRVYPLHSSFAPTFNMAVNLISSSDMLTARQTLDTSFAQWEANASAVRLRTRIDQLQQALRAYEQAFHCEHGDFAEFMDLRMRLKDAQHDERRRLKHTLFTDDTQRKHAFETLDRKIALLRQQEREHPCSGCAQIQDHLRWGYHWVRERRELVRVQERYDSRTGSVVRAFDHICEVLQELAYVQPNSATSLCLTERGQLLRRLYNELDVVFAQSIIEGLFEELSPAELASCLSALVYESRGPSTGEPRRYPGGDKGRIAMTVARMRAVFVHVSGLCAQAHLPALRTLDFGAIDIMYDWAQGADLAQILSNADITGGDFVRQAKRLVDILTQLASAASYLAELNSVDQSLAARAHEAAKLINRGVVAYSDV